MLRFTSIVGVVALAVSNSAAATQPQPYAGQEQRAIKSFSHDEVQSYLAGKGAGLAKTAELNHYPGPLHVLELAGMLQLSAVQKTRTEAVFKAMQAEAIRQGTLLVEQERELDRQFVAGTITSNGLRSALRQIGKLQAEVRRAHLQAHLEQKAILTQEQIARYDDLRGYGLGGSSDHTGHAHNH